MKSQLLFVVVMFISSVLSQNYAQNFDILIGTTNDEVAIYLTENLQNNFIITGVKATSEPSARNAYIAEISPDGDLIQERTIVFPDSNSIISAVLQKENENYLCFGSIGSGIKDNVLLLELDHNFNIINKKKYAVQGGKRIDALDYLINSEGNIILYGTAIEGDISNPDFDLFLFETNNSFDSLQMDCQVNNETGIFNLVNSVIPKPNGGYYLQTINYDNQSRGQVLNLNRNFEILSYRAIPYEVAHGTLKWYSHNKFILTGKKTINKDNLPDDQIVSLIADTAFSQVYEELHMGAVDTSDIPGIETSVAYYDKNYIYIVGTHNYAYTEYPTHESYIYVARTDSLLNLKWEKFYGDGEAFYLTWA
ncbi:MAG: hypothetical protein U9N85_07730, partial [Bacteroidota bacterium]|nr:hypothetical protein [Bacteroidota bacterium]